MDLQPRKESRLNALKTMIDARQLSLSVHALMPAVIRFDMPTPQNKQYFRKEVTIYAKYLDITDTVTYK